MLNFYGLVHAVTTVIRVHLVMVLLERATRQILDVVTVQIDCVVLDRTLMQSVHPNLLVMHAFGILLVPHLFV